MNNSRAVRLVAGALGAGSLGWAGGVTYQKYKDRPVSSSPLRMTVFRDVEKTPGTFPDRKTVRTEVRRSVSSPSTRTLLATLTTRLLSILGSRMISSLELTSVTVGTVGSMLCVLEMLLEIFCFSKFLLPKRFAR